MAFDRTLVDDVLKQTDIVDVISNYINVIKKGRNYVAVCPFHDDKNPSLMISKEKQIFKCFVCGHGGTAISFVQDYEKIPFGDAIRKVADIAGFADPRLVETKKALPIDAALVPLFNCITDLAVFYQYGLSTPEGSAGLDYLNSRNLDEPIRAKYQLGYALADGKKAIQFLTSKGHSLKTIEAIGISNGIASTLTDRNAGRVMFPIADANGQVVGFSARRIVDSDEAKYINTPETKIFHKATLLYNYQNARRTARHDGYIYVLEGFMDIYALSKVGIESAVALMGTNMSKEHIALLRKLGVEIRLCLDGDRAGQSAMMKIITQLGEERLPYRIVNNQNDERDPDDILQEEGPDALKAYMARLINRAEFALNYYKQTNTLKTMEERKRLVADFIPILNGATNPLEFEEYINELSRVSEFSVDSIKQIVNKSRDKDDHDNYVGIMAEFHAERRTYKRYQLAERALLTMMLSDPHAVDFYSTRVEYFYEELYRNIANFIVEYKMKNERLDLPTLLSELSQSELDHKQEMQDEITAISLEKTHPECTEQVMEEYRKTILEEREKFYDKEVVNRAMVGKTAEEQGRIAAEYMAKRFPRAKPKDKDK